MLVFEMIKPSRDEKKKKKKKKKKKNVSSVSVIFNANATVFIAFFDRNMTQLMIFYYFPKKTARKRAILTRFC
jgi:mRNA degradation ribonuclease J1/J2